jgi:hypothetical protein
MQRIFQDAQGLIYKVHQFEELGREEAEKLLHEFEDGVAVLKAYLGRSDTPADAAVAPANDNNAPVNQPANGGDNGQDASMADQAAQSGTQPTNESAPQDGSGQTTQGDQAGSTTADPSTQVTTPPAPTDFNSVQPPAPTDPSAQPAVPAVDPNQAQTQTDPNATFNIQ